MVIYIYKFMIYIIIIKKLIIYFDFFLNIIDLKKIFIKL